MHSDTSAPGDACAGTPSAGGRVADAVAAGEAVLAKRFGSAITLSDAEDLAGSGPAVVLRVRVKSSPFSLAKTLVVKHYTDTGPDGLSAFATEAAGYQLFTALTSKERMCPEPIGHDAECRTLVLSDLGNAPTLADKLHGDDDRAAEKALLSWSRALGKMHATTARREADFNALLRRLGARSVRPNDPSAARRLPPILDGMGVKTTDTVKSQVSAAEEAVHGKAYRAFSPVDLAPENNLVTSNGVRFLDFEHGCVRSALQDVAHLRVPFAFWSDAKGMPAGMSDAMIAAWRSEAVEAWPQLGSDETFRQALLASQLECVWTQTLREIGELTTDRAAALHACWQDLAAQAQIAGAADVSEHAADVARAIDARYGPGLKLGVYPAFA